MVQSWNELEKRMNQLEENNRLLEAQIGELRLELDLTVKKVMEPASNHSSSTNNDKMSYLQEVNEQMFQQNVRLRNLLEKCINQQTIPTQEQYYEALREDVN